MDLLMATAAMLMLLAIWGVKRAPRGAHHLYRRGSVGAFGCRCKRSFNDGERRTSSCFSRCAISAGGAAAQREISAPAA